MKYILSILFFGLMYTVYSQQETELLPEALVLPRNSISISKEGAIRYNSQGQQFEGHDHEGWKNFVKQPSVGKLQITPTHLHSENSTHENIRGISAAYFVSAGNLPEFNSEGFRIPDGMKIDSLEVYFFDNSPSQDIEVSLKGHIASAGGSLIDIYPPFESNGTYGSFQKRVHMYGPAVTQFDNGSFFITVRSIKSDVFENTHDLWPGNSIMIMRVNVWYSAD